jgi:hypothetical protein
VNTESLRHEAVARSSVIDSMVAFEGSISSMSPCDWCGRPGTVHHVQVFAFGHVVVEDPLLCNVCNALLCIDQLRGGWSPREAGVDLALEIIASQQQNNLLDPRIDRAVTARTQSLLQEVIEARETITALKAELRRWSAEDGEVERPLGRLGV